METVGRFYKDSLRALKPEYMVTMKQLAALLIFLSSTAFGQTFNTCYLCVQDPSDSDVTKECDKWFTLREQKSCDYTVRIFSKDSPIVDSGKTCESVRIWGGFHGLSYYYNYPLNISSQAAEVYSAKDVAYDGSTCLVFNNTETVKNRAQALAALDTRTRYLISGNQNTGVVSSKIPFITKPTENLGMASKLTLEIVQGQVNISYGDCSKAGAVCGYAQYDVGAASDSNTKFCMNNGELTEQTCCVKMAKQEWGKWSYPGESCLR